MNYFDKIPTITYNDNLCKNLLARARLSDNVRKQKTAFYPYTMDAEDRVDNLSNMYYDDPGYTWLIWMTNNTIDPYFDFPLNEDDFNSYIISKYGSYYNAAHKIKVYRNNWYDNTDQSLTVALYNALSDGTQRYFEPVLDSNLNVAKYVRKRHDELVATNKIMTLSFASTNGTFIVGEEVRVGDLNRAFITYVGTNTITIQHITGSFEDGDSVVGQESTAAATITTATTITTTLAGIDNSYWNPVTYLEYEQDINEAKKVIKLLDNRFTNQAESDLRRVMLAR